MSDDDSVKQSPSVRVSDIEGRDGAAVAAANSKAPKITSVGTQSTKSSPSRRSAVYRSMLAKSQLSLAVVAAAVGSALFAAKQGPGTVFAGLCTVFSAVRFSRFDSGRCATIARKCEHFASALPWLRVKCLDSAEQRAAIHAAVPWAVLGAAYAPSSPVVKRAFRHLMCCEQFTLHLQWTQAFGPLREGCAKRLRALGNFLRTEVFERRNLRSYLGTYRPPLRLRSVSNDGLRQTLMPHGCTIFRSLLGTGPAPSADVTSADRTRGAIQESQPRYAADASLSSADANNFGSHVPGEGGCSPSLRQQHAERAYIHFLRMIALALAVPFEESVNSALRCLLVGGQVTSNGIKGYERMYNKMCSPSDHGTKPFPRPAHNVDVVRVIATFNSEHEMVSGFGALANAFGGEFLQFKNGFTWGETYAREQRSDLRIVLATVQFAHPTFPTIGQLRSNAAIRRLWDTYLDTEAIPELVPREQWRLEAQQARAWIDELEPSTPAQLACEVQCLLQVYRDIRNHMHELYKVVRATDETGLHNDFKKYGTRLARERVFLANSLLAACRDGDVAHVQNLIAQRLRTEANREFTSEWTASPRAARRLLGVGDGDMTRVDHDDSDGTQPGASLSQERKDTVAHRKAHMFLIDALGTACEFVHPEVVRTILQALASTATSDAQMSCRPVAQSDHWHSESATNTQIAGTSCCSRQARADSTTSISSAVNTVSARTGWTALQRACGVGDGMSAVPVQWRFSKDAAREEIVQQLLVRKADTNYIAPGAEQPFDQTPVWIAARLGFTRILRLLLKNGGVVNVKCGLGASPLIMAAQGDHTEAVDCLLEHKADIDAANKNGTTPLIMAAQLNHAESVQLLLERKANVNLARSDGVTSAYLAAQDNFTLVLELLIDAHADINQPCDDSETPVFVAAECGQAESLDMLLKAKALVDPVRVDDGVSPLAAAAIDGHADCLAILLKTKADANRKCKAGRSPLEWAQFGNHIRAAEVLRRASSNL